MDKMKKLNDEELENVVGGVAIDPDSGMECIDWRDFADDPNALIGRKVSLSIDPFFLPGEITAIGRTSIVDGKTWVMSVTVEWGDSRYSDEKSLRSLVFID